jgi:membrane protease subunit HflC
VPIPDKRFPPVPRPEWKVTPQQAWRWLAIGLLVAFLITFGAFGMSGVTEVKDHEVGVWVNYVTGKMEVDQVPGKKIYIPFIHQVFTLDKSPNRFLMEGKADESTDRVRELTVRAADGSNFWFETLEIQYQLIPGDAEEMLKDSGTGDAFKKFWLMSFARSILRDEFGKFDPEQISNPIDYSAARVKAQERLNAALKPHGIEVTQITMPKPKFASEYEKAIEDRKLADQEVERLKAKAIQLEKEKAKRLAEIESVQGQEFASLKGTLIASKTDAEAEKVKLQREADAYKIERTGEGEAQRLAKIEEARGLTEKYQKEAQGLLAKAEALARQGQIVVVEALAKKLAAARIEIVPYQRTESPARIEVEPARVLPAAFTGAGEKPQPAREGR